jgi:hypothetical protein
LEVVVVNEGVDWDGESGREDAEWDGEVGLLEALMRRVTL